eukprot:6721855-Lingulodinium_polyedra.AAC.1
MRPRTVSHASEHGFACGRARFRMRTRTLAKCVRNAMSWSFAQRVATQMRVNANRSHHDCIDSM